MKITIYIKKVARLCAKIFGVIAFIGIAFIAFDIPLGLDWWRPFVGGCSFYLGAKCVDALFQ